MVVGMTSIVPEHHYRYWRPVEHGYLLQPGFEP